MPILLRGDFDATRLRLAARQSEDADQVRRLLALAAIYDGARRTEAAAIGGVTLQVVRDWVLRFNERGPNGLIDRKAPGPSPRLNEAHRRALAAMVESGPMPAVHGVVRWRLADLAQWVWEEFRVAVGPQTVSRELHGLGYRKLSARPRHHAQAAGAVEDFKTYGPPRPQAVSTYDLPVCINVSGLWAQPRPRWRSARPGPHKTYGVRAPFLKPGCQNAG